MTLKVGDEGVIVGIQRYTGSYRAAGVVTKVGRKWATVVQAERAWAEGQYDKETGYERDLNFTARYRFLTPEMEAEVEAAKVADEALRRHHVDVRGPWWSDADRIALAAWLEENHQP